MSSDGWTGSEKANRGFSNGQSVSIKLNNPSKGLSGSTWTSGSVMNIDSKESANNFLAAAGLRDSPKPQEKIKPVPGVPPHLWHKFQEGAQQQKLSPQINKGKDLQQKMPQQPADSNNTGYGGRKKSPQQAPTSQPRVPVKQWSVGRNDPKPFFRSGEANVQYHMAQYASDLSKMYPQYQALPDRGDSHHQDSQARAINKAEEVQTNGSSGWEIDMKYHPRGLDNSRWKPEAPPASKVQEHRISAPRQSYLPDTHGRALVSVRLTEEALRNAAEGYERQGVTFDWEEATMNPPGLDGHGVPRRNPKFSGSTPSLPSVSDIAVSDTGVEGLGARSPNEGSDIRNTIGPKHNIRSQDGKWVRKHNWDNPLGLEDDYVFNTMPFNDAFVTAWDNGVPHDISADFLDRDVREHWRCDVDTNTGYLIPPVEYPETLVDLGKLREELDWRRQNWTSALLIRRNTANTRGNLRGRRYENFQLRHYQEPNEPEIFEINPVVEEPKIEIVHNSLAPRVASYLRPAQKADMAAVTAIYNWEMKNGLQTLDSQPLSVEDFEKIFDDTQKLGMPFLVAVTGSAKDLKSKHNGAVTLSLYRHMPVDMVTLPSQDRNGKILGFAYLSVWQPGLAGSGVGSSRATASINLFVDPQFRKMKIGFSLMDKLLSTISRRFSSESAYDFVDPTRSPVYQGPKSHERQYFRLYLSYLVKHKYADHQLEEEQKTYDDDLKWVKKLLEEKFNFREKIRFEAVHRSAKAREGPLCWLDSVVFEHACQFGPADCTY